MHSYQVTIVSKIKTIYNGLVEGTYQVHFVCERSIYKFYENLGFSEIENLISFNEEVIIKIYVKVWILKPVHILKFLK